MVPATVHRCTSACVQFIRTQARQLVTTGVRQTVRLLPLVSFRGASAAMSRSLAIRPRLRNPGAAATTGRPSPAMPGEERASELQLGCLVTADRLPLLTILARVWIWQCAL